LRTRSVEAANFANRAVGLAGRGAKPPPQLGQRPAKRASAQSAQKVHSKLQIIAPAASGARSASQHSQFGRSWSILASDCV
jgi:hypothetical protein